MNIKKMNKRIKKKWLKALRSGEYKQGKMRLRYKDEFCCLGVLCDLHSKETSIKWGNNKRTYFHLPNILPNEVVEWSGLDSDTGKYKGKHRALTTANDSGYSFKQIANIIENQF